MQGTDVSLNPEVLKKYWRREGVFKRIELSAFLLKVRCEMSYSYFGFTNNKEVNFYK